MAREAESLVCDIAEKECGHPWSTQRDFDSDRTCAREAWWEAAEGLPRAPHVQRGGSYTPCDLLAQRVSHGVIRLRARDEGAQGLGERRIRFAGQRCRLDA